jgi:hypothetical protein
VSFPPVGRRSVVTGRAAAGAGLSMVLVSAADVRVAW